MIRGDVEVAKCKPIRVVELFAGVGGFRVGLESCSKEIFKTVWANQWEPGQSGQWAFKCYEQHYGKDARCINSDIATAIDQVPEHDLLVGGFPCQDYSVASTGARGIEGKKGVLWWSIDEIVRKRHPNYILLENVDRLLKSPSKQRGRDFAIILKCLEAEGYAVEWRVINAADYGNVQRRRRTFIFAYRNTTAFYKTLSGRFAETGASNWLKQEGFFAKAFPVAQGPVDRPRSTTESLDRYADLLAVTDRFHAAFYNGGLMFQGTIYSEELVPKYTDPLTGRSSKPLSEIVSRDGVDERYLIPEKDKKKWEEMKGAKKISRTSRDGYEYLFSEGAIAFPDPLDRPARTMLTSEGSKNRSSHVIEDPLTGRLRRLTPEECELINGFPPGWTDTGMPERQRYFIMGNALVVPLIEKMGHRLLEIV